jgi:hypothetical protein
MGRDRGRNEDNLLELECLPDFFRPPEVTQMDGIEGPAEQPNPSTRGLLFDLSTLPYIESKIRNVKCQSSNAEGNPKLK